MTNLKEHPWAENAPELDTLTSESSQTPEFEPEPLEPEATIPPTQVQSQSTHETQAATPQTQNRLAELSATAASYVGQLSHRFEAQYGYKPSDETLFGWQMQAESILQNHDLQQRQVLAGLETQATAVEQRFEQSGFPRSAGRHYLNIVKETGTHIIGDAQLNRLAVAQAIGLAALDAKGHSAPKLNAESVTGDVTTGGINHHEAADARRRLRTLLRREPTAAEINEWMEL